MCIPKHYFDWKKYYVNEEVSNNEKFCASEINNLEEDIKILNESYKNIKEVSFMIFRTGSVLIVGMCVEDVLFEIYEFLKLLLLAEFENVCQGLLDSSNMNIKDKKKQFLG
jgi:hypothetical protein